MPDLVVHNAMGDRVLAKLPREIAEEIDGDAFHVGVLGPDPYFFYRFFALPFTNGVDKRGGIMHHEKCREYLMELARLCCRPGNDASSPVSEHCAEPVQAVEDNSEQATSSEQSVAPISVDKDDAEQLRASSQTGAAGSHSRIAFSYLAGALCHYALDSTAHPYINAKAAKRPGMHTAVERKLDRLELKRQGRRLSDIMRLFVPFPEVPEIRAAMKSVYGWDDERFRDGYRHMRLFLWFVKDEHGVLAAVIGVLSGILSGITGRKADYIRAQSYRNHMADDLDLSGFTPLENAAVDLAVRLITEAHSYRAGLTDDQNLHSLIGSRDYSGRE